jgi:membrane-associated phospholipid phosphatase
VLTAVWTLSIALAAHSPAPPNPSSLQAAPWPDDRPFARLLPNLMEDFKALPTQTSGLILAGGVVGAIAVKPADDNATDWARDHGVSSLADFGRALGSGWTQAGGAVGAYVVGRVTGRAELTHIGSDLVRGQVMNGLITRVAKLSNTRRRPGGGPDAFPSGHTSSTFTTAAVLQGHYGWTIGAPAYAAAALVGWSSVRDRAHWLTDVVAGATLGTIVGYTVTRGHQARDWQIVPVRTDGGFAVFLVRR